MGSICGELFNWRHCTRFHRAIAFCRIDICDIDCSEKQLHQFLSYRNPIYFFMAVAKLYENIINPIIRHCLYITDNAFGSQILVHGKRRFDYVRKLRMDDNQLLDDYHACGLYHVI